MGKAALHASQTKKAAACVRRLCCMNNSRSFEDDVDEGPRERLLVGDGARQRLQGRPFRGASLLLLARPSARSRPSVKYTDTDGRLFYTPVPTDCGVRCVRFDVSLGPARVRASPPPPTRVRSDCLEMEPLCLSLSIAGSLRSGADAPREAPTWRSRRENKKQAHRAGVPDALLVFAPRP